MELPPIKIYHMIDKNFGFGIFRNPTGKWALIIGRYIITKEVPIPAGGKYAGKEGS